MNKFVNGQQVEWDGMEFVIVNIYTSPIGPSYVYEIKGEHDLLYLVYENELEAL